MVVITQLVLSFCLNAQNVTTTKTNFPLISLVMFLNAGFASILVTPSRLSSKDIHKDDDEKGFELDRDNTVCFMRGTPERDSYLDLLSQLERIGVPMVNSRVCLERAVDKYRTYLRLKDFGLYTAILIYISA